jgi:hypothetical protein
MGNVDCRNLLSNNQNGNEIKYTFSVDTHHNLNININSITNFPEDIKIINTQNPIILNNSLNINNNSISSQEMVFSPKEIKSISTPSSGSEENKKIIEENGNGVKFSNFCKNVSKIENIHEKSEESDDSESENENDNEKGKGKEKENQDNNNPNQNHNIRRMSTILNFEHRRMPIEIIEEKQREKSKLSINQQIKINSQNCNNDNEQKNIETPKENNNNFNKLSFNINFNQFQTNYNGIQNNNFPINNILNNNNNIINNFKANNNSLNNFQGNNNGITNSEKKNIQTNNFENKDNPTNNLKNNNNPINKIINNNNPINNFENKNNPINFQNNKNQFNDFQNPYTFQNNNLLINHNNIHNHNIQNCNNFNQNNLKKLNVPQNKENQKKIKNLNIINIIPLEKRTKVYDNTILLNGYFNVFSRKTFPNSKLETTLRFIILTRSELKIYRSLETKLFQKNPLRRISLFNISKCDLYSNDNSQIINKNLELYFNFYIEFITLNKMINNDETFIIHHENNYKKKFNYKLIHGNYINNSQRRKKKISYLGGSTLDNGVCKSKNFQNKHFDNNSEILVFSSNDEKLINQWVTVINYFINC